MIDKNEKEEKRYSEVLEKYFIENEVIIEYLPEKYCKQPECGVVNEKISTMQQFVEYVDNEEKFWTNDLTKSIPLLEQHKQNIIYARQNIANAVAQADSANVQTVHSYLKNAMHYLMQPGISSKSKLAQYLAIEYKEEKVDFKLGFLFAQEDDIQIMGRTSEFYQGFYYGMKYRDNAEDLNKMAERQVEYFSNEAQKAADSLSKINQLAADDFYTIKSNMETLVQKNDEHLVSQKERYEQQIEGYEKKISELEFLYTEKLKLSKPAEYWSKMAENYIDKGRLWLIFSVVIGILTVGMLMAYVIYLPEIYTESGSDWFNTFKITTILAVITSIAVYILRTVVKLSMSSYHLGIDAKEREQLAYFYLALQNDKAISEKERDIIITSLFSRSDSGLLKGDSSPTMPTNITDILSK